MRGVLVVCEGLDCSGKTTAIEKIINLNQRYVYSKGIGSNSFVGRMSRRFPSTFAFLFELLYNAYACIIPNLRKNKIIMQDRYDISIASFVPNTKRWYNRVLINITRLLIPKPDAVVYFHLPLDERIKRLRKKGDKYELMLAENPYAIIAREREYEKWFYEFSGRKIKIDTKINNTKQTSKILMNFVESLAK